MNQNPPLPPQAPHDPHTSVIFIIDDEEIVIEMLTAFLQEAGFSRIHGFEDSVEAIDTFEQLRPDLILTDIHMPEASGNFLTKLVRSHKGMKTVPVVAVTADARPEVARKIMGYGADAVLVKPVDNDQLVQCVCETLEKYQRINQEQQQQIDCEIQQKAQASARIIGQETELRELFGRPGAAAPTN